MPDLNAPEARIPDAMESMRLLFDGSGAMRGRMTSQMAELAAASAIRSGLLVPITIWGRHGSAATHACASCSAVTPYSAPIRRRASRVRTASG